MAGFFVSNMLYVTTSNGVYRVDSGRGTSECILRAKRRRGIFRSSPSAFFGIAIHGPSGMVLAASRERLGTPRIGKPSTDSILHAIDPPTCEHSTAGTVRDVHDVHQIACLEDIVFLTDTGKNRVIAFDLLLGETKCILNLGDERRDVNHVNALLLHESALWISLNNSGASDAEILRVPLAPGLPDGEVSAYSIGEIRSVPGLRHSHDLVPLNEILLTCASREGLVLRADTGEVLFEAEKWTRGLAVSPDALWVGASEVGDRSQRHRGRQDGWVLRYTHDFELEECITIVGAGQVNDLLWLGE